MKVTRIRALRGPNLWSRCTAIEAIVYCNDEECSIGRNQEFLRNWRQRVPQADTFQPSGNYGAVTLAHLLERATVGLQIQAGCPVAFSKTMQTLEAGTYQIIIEYSEEAVGRLALDLAQNLYNAAVYDLPFDLADAVGQLRKLDEELRMGPSTSSIVRAASARGIPFRRLTNGSMVQLGWGSGQRRIQAAETDMTDAVAESIAQDKELTRALLSAAGVPVAASRPVADIEDA
jgi:cyanophycin synthetase